MIVNGVQYLKIGRSSLGFVELCAKILQIMRSKFKDYARNFCQLWTHYVHLFGFV